jgi:hypothetical protein
MCLLPDDFFIDIFKSLIGAFIGAGLAFLFALHKDKLTRLRAQKAAGNMAVTTLARMLNDFIQVRDAIIENRDEVLAEQPHSPIWMLLKPFPLSYAENLKFDIESLTFLFDHEDGAAVFEKLLTVEIKYHNFFHMLGEHRIVSQDAQDVLAEKIPNPTEERPLKEVIAALGFARVARMESTIKVIFEHVDGSEKFYLAAAEALPALLRKLFGKKGLIKIAPPASAAPKKAA